MSLTLNRLLARPKLNQIQRIIPPSHIDIKFISEINNGYMIDFNVRSETDRSQIYLSSIWLSDKDLSNDTLVKVKCNCPNFIYKFETVLATIDGLIDKPHSLVLPKHQSVYICKHLEACIKKIMVYKNLDNIIQKNQVKWSGK